jgi:prevent-host-death family protein
MQAGIAELKANLSRFLDRVKSGEEIVVTERGRGVAKLVPLTGQARGSARRERLVREGLLLPGRRRLRPGLRKPPAGDVRVGRGVLQALLEDRSQGR